MVTNHSMEVIQTHRDTCSHTHTCMEVMEAVCACRTVMGAQVRRHHTRMTLSQLAEAMSVFS